MKINKHYRRRHDISSLLLDNGEANLKHLINTKSNRKLTKRLPESKAERSAIRQFTCVFLAEGRGEVTGEALIVFYARTCNRFYCDS